MKDSITCAEHKITALAFDCIVLHGIGGIRPLYTRRSGDVQLNP